MTGMKSRRQAGRQGGREGGREPGRQSGRQGDSGTRNFYFKSWGKRKKLRNLVTPTRNLCPLGAPSYEILSPKALFGISPMGKSKKTRTPSSTFESINIMILLID